VELGLVTMLQDIFIIIIKSTQEHAAGL